MPGLILLLSAATAIASAFIWKSAQKWEPDFRQIARRIEQQHPELHALLLTAVEQTPDAATGEFNYLQQRVIDEAVSQNKQHQWIETISRARLLAMEWVQLLALVALVFALYRSDQGDSRFQAFVSGSPGGQVRVSPQIGALRGGFAFGIRMKFRA